MCSGRSIAKISAFLILAVGISAQAQSVQDLSQSVLDRRQTTLDQSTLNVFPAGKPVAEIDVNVDAKQVQNWFKYFDLVVIVDKAKNVQRLNAYRRWDNGDILNVFSAPVSTGTETYGCTTKKDPETGETKSVRYFAQTPTGYYNPSYLDIDHFSRAYRDGHMPSFVNFIPQLGVGTHGHDGGRGIGQRHSHGCVRMNNIEANVLFELVMLTGGPVNVNSPFLNARCGAFEKDGQCVGNYQKRVSEARESVLNTLNDGASIAEPRPYKKMPLVPVVRRDGSFQPDPKNPGQPLMKPGYRTLYIVKNSHPELDPKIPENFSCPAGADKSDTRHAPRIAASHPLHLNGSSTARARKPEVLGRVAPLTNSLQKLFRGLSNGVR